MTNAELYAHVDHTQLKAYATWKDIVKLCDEAIKYRTASVCVPPSFIKKIKETYKESLDICTVIGFPLGYSTTEVKVKETLEAIKDGADEIDMVINIGDVKNGDYSKVLSEIKALKNACGNKILKVIVETCYLDEAEKIKMCEIVTEAGADYIKTSTGFGTGGATFDDVKLFKEHIGQNVKIKAAGGIRTKEDMETFLSLGADRLGTSSAVSILEG
jgi:deoxyribose-phosphate aldolase